MIIVKLIATCFGIGYIQKGAGTMAALFCCLFWYRFKLYDTGWPLQFLHIAAVFFVGVLASGKAEFLWGHDSNRVVVDEWLGMSVALFLIPFTWVNYLLAFLLFRFFDILKPFYIRKAENLTGGWGVMADDLLAGIYSVVILHLLIKSHLF